LLSRLVDGAQYFEQLVELSEVARRGEDEAEAAQSKLGRRLAEIAPAFLQAVYRCFSSSRAFSDLPELRWVATTPGDVLLKRVSAAAGFSDLVPEAELEQFGAWLQQRIRDLDVGGTPLDERTAVALHKRLTTGPYPQVATEFGSALKARMRSGYLNADTYDALDDLWRNDEQLFEPNERDELADELESYARERLTDGDLDEHELDALETVAEVYGVMLDDVDLNEARTQIAHNSDYSDIDEERGARYEDSDTDATDGVLDELFASLGDYQPDG